MTNILDDYNLSYLKYDDKSQIDAICNLHIDLVSQSHPSRLGQIFMKKFYFTTLVKLGLIQGLLFKLENRYVGFTLFTKYPDKFIYMGIKKAPVNFILTILIMVLNKPNLLIEIINMIRVKSKNRKPLFISNKTGQWLTFGVVRSYLKYTDEEGKRISHILVEQMINWFRAEKYKKIIAAVRKQNIVAILFYQSLGFSMVHNNDSKNEFFSFSIDLNAHQMSEILRE